VSGADEEKRYREALVAGRASMGWPENPALVDLMWAHQALVFRWAQRMNISGILDAQQAAIRNGVDSLILESLLAEDEGELVDVGSGAGFPGLVIALARPSLRVRLWEPSRKRCSFLRVAVGDLRLENVQVETLNVPSEPDGALLGEARRRTLVSRATFPLPELVRRLGRLLSVGDVLLTTAGLDAPSDERMAAMVSAEGLHQRERHRHVLPDGSTRVTDVIERLPPVAVSA
jgi:16S rRNA (guanine(527)-N(7))-methyltransferase RsmG